jgi:hypothetical protein
MPTPQPPTLATPDTPIDTALRNRAARVVPGGMTAT